MIELCIMLDEYVHARNYLQCLYECIETKEAPVQWLQYWDYKIQLSRIDHNQTDELEAMERYLYWSIKHDAEERSLILLGYQSILRKVEAYNKQMDTMQHNAYLRQLSDLD